MMFKLLSIAALVAAAVPAHAQSVQPWPDLVVVKPLGDGWVGSGEVVGRAGGEERQSQFESRLQIGHTLGRSLTAWAGWVHFANFVPGAPNTAEDQAVEQLNWAIGSVGSVRFATRSRLEQRFLSNLPGTNWRFRQQLRAVYATGGVKSVGLVLWSEPFLALNRTPGQRHTLDQLRSFAGVTVPVARTLDFEVGYLNQRVYRANDTLVNHAIPLVLTYRF
ncbi:MULTISPECIES: DUF2490 domain-containing protein [unclassified Sphingomonas]|uniref:DUF2490 domain-containing protein n=1 Tax=unclassified Sphingomonas TaxID=196159 RepID=UPI001F56F191|nr:MULTISPECIES: DUF2490 domain-containing protein [unclassified Sphingomonas]